MNVCILGTGAYGLALALMFNKNNCNIKMWTKFEEEKEMLNNTRMNNKVLPNIIIPNNIEFTTNLEEAVNDAKIIVFAIPAGAVSDTCILLKNYIKPNQHICIASKGIEQQTCLFIHEVILNYIKTDKIAVISGPTFAIDMASSMPTALSLGTTNEETKNLIMNSLQNNTLKIRVTEDILGLEICGSIKNIMALAAGVLDGLGYNESTNAMFITESIHDIKELIDSLGGDKNTILSYAGIGDLLLTCTSTKSRNYTLGKLIGSKQEKEIIKKYIEETTIEGLYTLKSIHQLIKFKNVDIPIIDKIYDIIVKEENPDILVNYLMTK